ncbi:MAG: VOC family protein [Pseudomonadota bacterium]
MNKFIAALATAASLTTAHADERPRPDPLAQIQAEHVMISTDSYDETIRWYREKLGFRVQHEWTVPEFTDVKLSYIEFLTPLSAYGEGDRK